MANYDKKQTSPTPENSTGKTTKKGPHGGGNKYNQQKLGSGFAVHDPIAGHTQKSNMKPLK